MHTIGEIRNWYLEKVMLINFKANKSNSKELKINKISIWSNLFTSALYRITNIPKTDIIYLNPNTISVNTQKAFAKVMGNWYHKMRNTLVIFYIMFIMDKGNLLLEMIFMWEIFIMEKNVDLEPFKEKSAFKAIGNMINRSSRRNL